MKLLHNSSLNDQILLILLELGCVVEVKLVIALINLGHLVLCHVKGDGKMSLEGEVRILDI